MIDIKQLFKTQIEVGATDHFFYGTEIGGVVRIEGYRGSIESLVESNILDELTFERMVGSTPFFTKEV